VSGTFADHSYPWYGDPPITEGVGAPGWATATLQTEISAASMIKAADKMTAGNYGGDNIIEATVNINTATLYGIQTLYNIEDVKGQAIIDTRRDARNCKGPDGLTDTEAGQWYTDARLSTIPLPPYTGDARGSPPYFANRGEIMMVYGVDKGIFQDCGDFVTVRSDRFRIYSTGTVGGAIRKIEAVVDRDFHDDGTMGPITVLYWSEKVFAD
ncbi:hypothetical protein KKD34_02140, partial [bacterium]|nr:hypothetical protein [bacterium]